MTMCALTPCGKIVKKDERECPCGTGLLRYQCKYHWEEVTLGPFKGISTRTVIDVEPKIQPVIGRLL